MIDSRELLRRAASMMAFAESADADEPGAAGLAYQAAHLAIRALLIETDGADIWLHDARNARAAALLDLNATDVAFIHHVRQLDFYGDTAFGGETALPTADECRRALRIARQIVDAASSRLAG